MSNDDSPVSELSVNKDGESVLPYRNESYDEWVERLLNLLSEQPTAPITRERRQLSAHVTDSQEKSLR